jgi:hypothetical protein
VSGEIAGQRDFAADVLTDFDEGRIDATTLEFFFIPGQVGTTN